MLELPNNLVSEDWLLQHLEEDSLVILNCTINKVTLKSKTINSNKEQIKGAIFFDIKNVFSDKESEFPNTVLSKEKFEIEAQKLGINSNSNIIVYDDLGIYSSPRVWWMFQLMGFTNIAVLNGGFPAWKAKKYPIETIRNHQKKCGNFKVDYQPKKIKFTRNILESIKNNNDLVIDARSNGRFLGTEPEPRKGVKSGHIPNSVSLPYSELLTNGKFKTESDLKEIFKLINPNNKELIFSCGTGITASILALGTTLSGKNNYAVYDGSWTEWGSTKGLPIEL